MSTVKAQISISPIELQKLSAGNFSQEDLDALKKTTTIFIYKDNDDVEKLNEIFTKYWKISKFKLIQIREYDKDKFDNTYSFLNICSYVKENIKDNSRLCFVYLNLWMNDASGKKKSFARIEISASHNTIVGYSTMIRPLYLKQVEVYNWGPGYIKNYIQIINDYLSKGETHSLYSDSKDAEIAKLKNDTLYVPNTMLIKYNMFTGEENKKFDEKDLMSDYKYPYKMVTNEEINKLILSRPQGIYYVLPAKSGTDKYISVINSNTGNIVYYNYTPVSYNFSEKDFRKISKSVE
ncbi:MAG: hypothetical protein JST26_11670 [Bacteroidetes bacterium]|nr:hypothetical protein [Bacteroidota bacterium]